MARYDTAQHSTAGHRRALQCMLPHQTTPTPLIHTSKLTKDFNLPPQLHRWQQQRVRRPLQHQLPPPTLTNLPQLLHSYHPTHQQVHVSQQHPHALHLPLGDESYQRRYVPLRNPPRKEILRQLMARILWQRAAEPPTARPLVPRSILTFACVPVSYKVRPGGPFRRRRWRGRGVK